MALRTRMMAGDLPTLRIERAIYLVAGLILGLYGFQGFVGVLLDVYNVGANGALPGPTSSFWVDVSIDGLVWLVITVAGLFLLILAARTHRSIRRAATPPTPSP